MARRPRRRRPANPMLDAMIELEGLTKRLGGRTVVEDVSFRCEPGTVTGFLGPNGAGKTTTLRMLTGLSRPDAGHAAVLGRPYAELPNPGRRVGVLLDAAAQHGGRRGREALAISAQTMGVDPARVDPLLTLVGLDRSAARKRVRQYSLGMRQRLGIASALLGDPPVLLFDEPINGLDPEGIQWIRALLRQFAREGRTVFISSHIMSEMELTADHLLVIGRGRLVADLSMEEMTRRSTQSHVRVVSTRAHELIPHLEARGALVTNGTANELSVSRLDAPEIGALAFELGIPLDELATQRASLETAFMELTHDSVQFRAEGGSTGTAATFEDMTRELAGEGTL